jgi:peptidoglycan hydrolase CwlO-like protein
VTTAQIITIVISSLALVVSLIFSIVAATRNRRTDDTNEGENKGVIMSDIGYIKAGVDDLKTQNRENAVKIGNLNERVTRVEESCKQAHHRIDELKGEQTHEKLG